MIQDIDEINVSIQDDNSINVSIDNDSISVSEATPTDIAEIMHNEEIRQENETQRIANEEQRIENETAREDYINDLKQRVLDGEFNGQDGQDGQDGFSPMASVSKSGDTATITITDKNGTTTAQISDGVDGHDGTDGQDGFSPSASVTKSGSVATITITDKSGTTTANIYDGSGGGGGIWGSITGTLSDQTDLQNALDEKQNIFQYETMPTTTASDEGRVVQYIGTTTSTYRQYGFYVGKETDPGSGEYYWAALSVDNLNLYQTKIDSANKLYSDLVTDAGQTNKFINSSAQTFTGAKTFSHINTDSEIINDSLTTYSSISINDEEDDSVFSFDGTTSGTPMFNRKLELSNGGTTTAPTSNNDIANKKYVDDNIPDISTKQDKIDSSHMLDADLVDDSTSANKFLTDGSQTIDGTKEFTSLPQYAFSTEPILSNELTTKAYVDNNFKYQRSTMPTAGSSYKNKVYQYTGTTTANYTNGYFYKCIRSGTSPNYTYSWERLDVQPSFSGDYNDLTNKPTIPDELADLSDDSTHRVVTDTEKTTWSGKQDALVSGTNIKTINNTSILGSGNIDVGADIPQQDTAPSNPQEDDLWIDTDEPGLTQIDSVVSTSSINPIENQAITNYVNDSVAAKQDKIDSSNKLDADLVDDSNSTNKFFSGNYNDLTNKPTIPTVNNATLTIQKNGTTVKTFTANASSNVTANITTPTITSLWSGSKNTTGDITLSQSYANFDLIAIAVAAPESTCEQVFFLWGGTITQNKELNFAIFQGTETCMSVSCKFTSNTKLNIIKFTNSTWWSNLMWVKSIKGIKF